MKYATDDGQLFDSMAEAKKHQAALKAEEKKQAFTKGLVNFLTARGLVPEAIEEVIAAIQTDPAAFAEAVRPLVRKARKPRADAGVPRGPRARAAA